MRHLNIFAVTLGHGAVHIGKTVVTDASNKLGAPILRAIQEYEY
jgi:hypothetical protein